MTAQEISRLARNERLARHAGFWWGLAEGVCFFIVPDVYITFATLFSLRAGAWAGLFSIAGSVVAIPIIYLVSATAGLDYLVFLDRVPGVSQGLIARVTEGIAGRGLPFTPWLIFGGVPLKVYAASAFSLGVSLGSVLLWTLFARIVRIAPTFALVAVVRLLLRRRIDTRPVPWAALHLLTWLAFYVFYFIRMGAV